MSTPREAYSCKQSDVSQARRCVDRNQPVADRPMLAHKYSVVDMEFQVQTRHEFNHIQYAHGRLLEA
ncbi:MAG: hypothetical protein DWI21_16115 [Planctomycetota bacterium]|nr:MAG: hypothetical protein DWI21_16115 [Planctomycetota bacterium]GDY10404.1 hypothetical protein LBMAG52_38920 [Planctomycetia bacterium]